MASICQENKNSLIKNYQTIHQVGTIISATLQMPLQQHDRQCVLYTCIKTFPLRIPSFNFFRLFHSLVSATHPMLSHSLHHQHVEDGSPHAPKRRRLLPSPAHARFNLLSLPDGILTHIVTFLPRHMHVPLVLHFPIFRTAVLEQSRSVLHELDLFPTAQLNDYPPTVSPSLITSVHRTLRVAKADLLVLRLHAGLDAPTTSALLAVARGCCPTLRTLAFADRDGVDGLLFSSVLERLSKLQELVVADPGMELVRRLSQVPSSCVFISLVETCPERLDVVLSPVKTLSSSRHADLSLDLSIGGDGSSRSDLYHVKRFTSLLHFAEEGSLDCLNNLELRLCTRKYAESLQPFVENLRNARHEGRRWLPLEMRLSIEVECMFRLCFPRAEDDNVRTSDCKGCSTVNIYGLITDMRAAGKVETKYLPAVLEMIISPMDQWRYFQWTDAEMDVFLQALQEHATGLQTLSVSRSFAVSNPMLLPGTTQRSLTGSADRRYLHVVRIITRFLTDFPSIVKLSLPRNIFHWVENPAILDMILVGRNLRILHLRQYQRTMVRRVGKSNYLDYSDRDKLIDLVQFLQLVANHCKRLICVYMEGEEIPGLVSSPRTRDTSHFALQALDQFEQRIPGVDVSTVRAQVEAWICSTYTSR